MKVAKTARGIEFSNIDGDMSSMLTAEGKQALSKFLASANVPALSLWEVEVETSHDATDVYVDNKYGRSLRQLLMNVGMSEEDARHQAESTMEDDVYFYIEQPALTITQIIRVRSVDAKEACTEALSQLAYETQQKSRVVSVNPYKAKK